MKCHGKDLKLDGEIVPHRVAICHENKKMSGYKILIEQ